MKKETIIDVSKQFRNLQVQYEKVVEQNRKLQSELREKNAECEELKQALDEIEQICCLLIDNDNVRRLVESILDIIKRTGGQRVKAERTRLMPAVQDAKQRTVNYDL